MLPVTSTLARLQAWYALQCNGVWEHTYGISIETCDNPGWWVKIDLVGTPLEAIAFSEISQAVDAQRFALGPRWLSCRVETGQWHGAGDETKLETILTLFLDWAQTHGG